MRKEIIYTCFFIIFTCMPCHVFAQNSIIPSLVQKTSNSLKWRIAYIEAGPYIDFPFIFNATIDALHTLGLIENIYTSPITDAKDTKKIWEWLSKNAGGEYIEFVDNAFYSGDWDENERTQNKKNLLGRLNYNKDIDMVLAFGTGAGIDMATNEHSVPMLSMSVTDARQAGIITSIEDSGLDHVHGQIEIGRYVRQLTIFHDIFKFKKLGVPVPTTDEGKASIAYYEILDTAKNLQFEIVPCELNLFNTEELVFENLRQCIEKLSKTSDAIYLTTNAGMVWDKMPQLLEPIIESGIPSFSQSGLMETKLGVLMCIAQNSFSNEGIHGANTMLQIFEGALPRSLGQVFEGPLGLAINLKMAKLIGWNPPFEILSTVDIVYQEIFTPENL